MKTVKLDNPITVEGIEISELTFRPVKVRDCLAMERAGSSDFEKEVGLIANLASVTKETIWELYFADCMKIQEELKDFFHRLHKGLKAKCTNALFRCRWRN